MLYILYNEKVFFFCFVFMTFYFNNLITSYQIQITYLNTYILCYIYKLNFLKFCSLLPLFKIVTLLCDYKPLKVNFVVWLVSLMVSRADRAKFLGSNPTIVTLCQYICIVLMINIEPGYKLMITDSVLINSKVSE